MSSTINRHMAQRKICKSPQREDFDEDFINRLTVGDWKREYDLDKYTVYRHAKALGLIEKRRAKSAAALENLIDQRCFSDIIRSPILSPQLNSLRS
jgi:hypothetical protein